MWTYLLSIPDYQSVVAVKYPSIQVVCVFLYLETVTHNSYIYRRMYIEILKEFNFWWILIGRLKPSFFFFHIYVYIQICAGIKI